METFSLKTENRSEFGGREAAKLRASGRYPATLVGEAQPTVQFSVSAEDFDRAVRVTARCFELELDGAATQAAIQDVQWDSMGDKILQIDFIRDPKGERAVARATEFGDKGYGDDDE